MVDAVWLILALLGKDEFFCFRFIFQKVFQSFVLITIVRQISRYRFFLSDI